MSLEAMETLASVEDRLKAQKAEAAAAVKQAAADAKAQGEAIIAEARQRAKDELAKLTRETDEKAKAAARVLAEQSEQGEVTALFREYDKIYLRDLVKIDELIIQLDLIAAVAFGEYTGNYALDVVSAEEFQHADTLVALENVEFVQIFIRLYRIVDALGDVRFAEVLPLDRELGALLKYRHKVGCEGGRSAARSGTDDLLQRYLNQTEVDRGCRLILGKDLVQYRQALGMSGDILQAELQCVFIVLFCHIYHLFSKECFRY